MIVLITGASGGLGPVLGRTLTEKGMRVYGTMRNPPSDGGNYPFEVLPMEISDSDSVARCVSTVMEKEGRIDVLINCVNRMIIGSVEEQTVEDVRRVLDTNVLGALRVCKEVIPAMKQQGSGTIVQMSSAAGFVAVPYMSAYSASKFAVEAFSEAMYHELKPSNVDVVLMEPVAMAMDRGDTGSHLELVDGVRSGSTSQKVLARMAKDTAASGLSPQAVSDRIYEVITSRKKPLRVPMDRAKTLTAVRKLAPQFVIDKLIADFVK
ncbi:MAG: SDR family oxidoreductase [Polyangiales bacterium]